MSLDLFAVFVITTDGGVFEMAVAGREFLGLNLIDVWMWWSVLISIPP